MSLHSRFAQFHEVIKLARESENATLVEKRETVLERLRQGLQQRFPDRGGRPRFEVFNQGSYAMNTGVVPVSGDYDIDIGVHFDVSTGDTSPRDAKAWVYDALKGHTSDVRWRRPCITVNYVRSGQVAFHVDVAVYARAAFLNHTYVAMGQQFSSADETKWERSEPRLLIDAVNGRHAGEAGAQFRRVVRYLKRWKDVVFPSAGNAAPSGIALTSACYQHFEHATDGWMSSAPNDHRALATVVRALRRSFQGGMLGMPRRCKLPLPVVPHDDLVARMTDQQMIEFEVRVKALDDALTAAGNLAQRDVARACELLRQHLGDDFPR